MNYKKIKKIKTIIFGAFDDMTLWGPIDPIGTICVGKDWAYGPISSPRIRAYTRTINKGRNENCFTGRGKEYLCKT